MRTTFVLVTFCALAFASCGGDPQDGEPRTPGAPTSAPTATALPSSTGTQTPVASPSPTAPTGPEWRRALPFWARAITTDAEGDVYLTGSQEVGPAQQWGRVQAMVLERSDPNGERVWVRRWTSQDRWMMNAVGFDVAISPDGTLVSVAGEIMDVSGENRRIRVWAFSPDGTLLWTREAPAIAFGSAVAAGDGIVVVGGYGWLGAWDSDGTELWTSDFEEPAVEHCNEVADVAIAVDGDIYAVGLLELTPTCNDMEGLMLEDADIVIQRRSASGDLRWSRVFDDAGVDVDRAFGMDVAGRGVFVTGEENGRAWLARISPNGRVRWTDRWGKAGSGVFGVDVSVSPWGAVYAVADRRPADGLGTLSLRRYTPDGTLEWRWSRDLPGGADVAGLATAPDDAVYVLTADCSGRCPLWRFPA